MLTSNASPLAPVFPPGGAFRPSGRQFTPYDLAGREFSVRDWERLWSRFVACLAGHLSDRERAKLLLAPFERRPELVRMHLALGHAPNWRFANVFEAIACEMEHDFTPAPSQSATAARPGSIEKIAVLAARIDAGEELYHSSDETIPLCSPVLE